MCLSHTIYHQHVLIVISIIFRVTYKNISNANILSKHESGPLEGKKNALKVLYSHWISVYIMYINQQDAQNSCD